MAKLAIMREANKEIKLVNLLSEIPINESKKEKFLEKARNIAADWNDKAFNSCIGFGEYGHYILGTVEYDAKDGGWKDFKRIY